MTRHYGLCMLALLFLIVVNVADFHQVGAASSAPSWMRAGAYVKYKGVVICTPAPTRGISGLCDALRNATTYELIEFVEAQQPVHEWTVEIMWKASGTPQVEEANPSYGLLDWQTGDLTFIGGDWLGLCHTPVCTPLVSYFFLLPTSYAVPTGFPPDSSKYAGVECRARSGQSVTPMGESGVWHLWHDKVTNLLVESRLEFNMPTSSYYNSDFDSVVWIDTLYETNIPVGNQALVSLETYPSVAVAVAAVVCLAAVGFAMFRKRTAIVCGQCGRKMRRDSKFCDKCGTHMPTPEAFHT